MSDISVMQGNEFISIVLTVPCSSVDVLHKHGDPSLVGGVCFIRSNREENNQNGYLENVLVQTLMLIGN